MGSDSLKINLYVDDLRDYPTGFVVARTYEQAIKTISENEIHILTLDHDLGEDDLGTELKNGYELVKYFCENGLRAEKIYLHTDNPVGRNNMYETLLAARAGALLIKTLKSTIILLPKTNILDKNEVANEIMNSKEWDNY